MHFFICRDFNIDYLIESERENRLENLLLSFNITSIISFPTTVINTSARAIDNIFLDTTRLKEHTVIPISNGLSDHDVQLLITRSRIFSGPVREDKTVRKFNDTISDFINKLSNESWDMVFNSESINDF